MASYKSKTGGTVSKLEATTKEYEAGGGVKVEMNGPYWITRNRTNGKLDDTVEVWLTKPDLCRFDDGDVMWLPDLKLVDSEVTYFAQWSIAKCLKECYTYPETERECLAVGK